MSFKPLPQLGFVLKSGTEEEFTASSKRVPKIPAALFDWVNIAAQFFWQDFNRCMAFMLLYDPCARSWAPELPYQEATAEGCKWSIARENLLSINPNFFLAGSLQSVPPEATANLESHIPPFGGIHFLVAVGVENQPHAFIRDKSGACIKAEMENVILDDRMQCITDALDRLELI